MVAVEDCFTAVEMPMNDVEVQWVKIQLKNNNQFCWGVLQDYQGALHQTIERARNITWAYQEAHT